MEVGLYGKLPSHGDFLRRRTSDAFVGVWDRWLQECMAESRAALGDRWLDVYLTSPAWRFAMAPGACGGTPVVGLLAPSVDRVGRYFPLTIVADLPAHVTPVSAAAGATAFFDRAESLVIETLEAELVDFEGFDRQVAGLADDLAIFAQPPPVTFENGASAVLGNPGEPHCQVPIASPGQLGSVFEQMLALCLSAAYDPLTLWWTEGSAMVDPSCLLAAGLPHPRAFAALLDGAWSQHQWRTVPARVEAEPVAEAGTLVEEPALCFRSAAESDVGKVRSVNQDSFLEQGESGVWVVADGVGGHADGETASRMVCDAFADFQQTGSFEDTIAAACGRLQAVNDQLVRAAKRSLHGDRSGSTVVALLARGNRCAVLWAGDSRAYRWRGGRLEQLTRDHTAAETGRGGANRNTITRAVGAEARLDLDVCRDLVQPGDRYLLCSDGLTKVISEAQLRAQMQAAEVSGTVRGLLDATLDAGAPDNVTALVVEACGAGMAGEAKVATPAAPATR